MIKKFLLLCSIIALCNCSSGLSFLTEPPVATRKFIALNESDTFIPEQLKDTSLDFITNALVSQVPDSIPDSALYFAGAPVFDPIPLDSGILLCEKDMALYINDKAWREYLQTEVWARKTFEKELIINAIKAESLFKDAVKQGAVNYEEIFRFYIDEREHKQTWKLIGGGTVLFFVGFVVASTIN